MLSGSAEVEELYVRSIWAENLDGSSSQPLLVATSQSRHAKLSMDRRLALQKFLQGTQGDRQQLSLLDVWQLGLYLTIYLKILIPGRTEYAQIIKEAKKCHSVSEKRMACMQKLLVREWLSERRVIQVLRVMYSIVSSIFLFLLFFLFPSIVFFKTFFISFFLPQFIVHYSLQLLTGPDSLAYTESSIRIRVSIDILSQYGRRQMAR